MIIVLFQPVVFQVDYSDPDMSFTSLWSTRFPRFLTHVRVEITKLGTHTSLEGLCFSLSRFLQLLDGHAKGMIHVGSPWIRSSLVLVLDMDNTIWRSQGHLRSV